MVSITEIVGSDEGTGALGAGLAATFSTGAVAGSLLADAALAFAAALAAVASATMRATSA
jgi:hypothetical protein